MRMTIVGSNPRAGGSECILFGHVGRQSDRFEPIEREPRATGARISELSAYGGWEVREMRPGADLGLALALVAASAGGDYCRTTGRVLMVAHRWSGVLQINDVGRKYTIDLYSQETRLVLLDVVNEIIVDVTGLASTADGMLKLPNMNTGTIVKHILESAAWFRFLERDFDFEPGLARRTIELFRRRPADALRNRLIQALLPAVNTRAAPIAAIPPQPAPSLEDTNRLRDELRLLASAVEGLALRAPAKI
jgi:hypothetical protein